MVEGPTARAYAIKICNKFGGEYIREVFVRSKKIFISIEELIGRKFVKADSFGKNIILMFDGDMVARLHLMMFGSIYVYELGESLLKPMDRVRLMLTGHHRKLVVYNAPIVELGRGNHILERLKLELGPDPLSNDWSEEQVYENIRKYRNEKIGVVLLNQSVMAGIGNILRNEILFRANINPERMVSNLSQDEIYRIIRIAKELSEKFLELKLQGRGLREILYVYNRSRGLCLVCGHPIKFYVQKPINRRTFVCEICQR
ncbi:MAG: hypothetical protein QW701_01465 [Candidatus Nezhaarchaeales archaeon]